MPFRRAARLAAGVAAIALLAIVPRVSAAGNTMAIDPATATGSQGGTLQVKVVLTSTVALSGAQATIVFDKTKLQVQTVTRGTAWASSTLFLGADAKSITAANSSGKLKTVAAAFLPPGSVPAGTADFLIVGFTVTGCGDSKLTLPIGSADATLLDGRDASYAAPVKVASTSPGAVSIPCNGSAGAGPSAGASGAPAASGSPGSSPTATDPLASVDPLASANPDASPSAVPSPGATSPALAPVGSSSGLCCGLQQQQDGWLTFALAALGVAAAGLALIIVLVGLALLVAAVVGVVWLIRTMRRRDDDGPGGPTSGPGAPAGEPGGDPPADGADAEAVAPEADIPGPAMAGPDPWAAGEPTPGPGSVAVPPASGPGGPTPPPSGPGRPLAD